MSNRRKDWLTDVMAAMIVALLLLIITVMFSGCNSVNRLIDGSPSDEKEVQVISSLVDLSATAPEFNVSAPLGYPVRMVYFGEMPIDGLVRLDPILDSKVIAFIRDRHIDQWFRVGNAGPFTASYNNSTGLITYKGDMMAKEYCVYRYTKS